MLSDLQSTSIIPPHFNMKTSLALAFLTAVGIICEEVHHKNYFLSDDFINQINSANLTWTAKRNFDPSTSRDTLRNLLGVLPDDGTHGLPYKKSNNNKNNCISLKSKHGVKIIPEQFDARDTWPECSSIRDIWSQGACGSCWAVASAATMTDRLCIHSNGSSQVQVSVQNLLSCSTSNGCHGGSPRFAWEFWVHTGLVSGGPFGGGGCQPYQVKPGPGPEYTPECHKYCENVGYAVPYEQDKSYGDKVCRIGRNVEDIQEEIMTNGPVGAALDVYDDFFSYSHGVYQHDPSFPDGPGPHAVRLLGWGEENGTPFWLGANSWSKDWGDQGLFKILRGENHCKIEQHIIAGLPKL